MLYVVVVKTFPTLHCCNDVSFWFSYFVKWYNIVVIIAITIVHFVTMSCNNSPKFY